MSEHVYAVLGSGLQGEAAAHDMARFGDARRILLADRDPEIAARAAERVDRLAGTQVCEPRSLDATDPKAIAALLTEADSCLSALPYGLNPAAAAAAVEGRCHFADLGGNTEVSSRVLALDEQAREAGVTLVPDCGLAPGLSATLAADLLADFDEPESLVMRCGGLPQDPKPPLDYMLVFSIGGLTNEYLGEAEVLRDGKLIRVPTLTEVESLEFRDPVGGCEAFTTSGGTSTLPQTFGDRLKNLDYKTVRYPGHCAKVAVFRDLGLWSDEPVEVDGQSVNPRRVFEAVASPALTHPDGRDLVVLRAELSGRHGGQARTRRLDVLDFHDETTGYTAMQRMTGYPAAMVVQALARGESEPGARPLETAVAPRPYLDDLSKRGIELAETDSLEN
ncbi:MAG: saccharopine dehydrogenase C-terminal domain-containing protein [Acidobacteriota bacterium]